MTRINFHLWWARLLDILTPDKGTTKTFVTAGLISLIFIVMAFGFLALSGGATW